MMWMWLLGPLGLVVVVAIVWALAQRGSGAAPPQKETPEQILKRRYARGEIDEPEYGRMLDNLRR